MNKHEIAKLACKLLGLYTFINAIGAVLSFVANLPLLMQGNNAALSLLYSTIPFLVWAFFGLILWFKADSFARAMVSDSVEAQESGQLSATEVQAIAFSVIGLVFLASSLPKAASLLGSLYQTKQNINMINPRIDNVAGVIVQFLVGLGLFLGSNGLVGLLKSLRYSGGKKS